MKVREKQKQYPRFRVGARIEHLILIVAFIILCFTGLPQKYIEYPISQSLIEFFGGIETTRIIHRWAAFALIAGSIYHLMTGAYRFYVKHERMRVVPDLKDVRDLRDYVLFNIGLKEEHPKMRKFNFGEKFEYWAVVWGTSMMIITGFMLLNPIATTSVLPGQFIPAALAAHGWEAVLAASAIIVWHLYNVLIRHFNPSMWTGKLPRNQMAEEHSLELERLEAGGSPWQVVDRPILMSRRRNFVIASVIFGALFLVFVIWIFTFEQTAITTIPRVTEEIFVPLATPVP